MRFVATDVDGAWIVELEPRQDDRGFFSRVFCSREFSQHGAAETMVQANLSRTTSAGTIRGLHYRTEPEPEAKFFRCIGGATFNVAVDLRPESPSYLRHVGLELSAENRRALYVPGGCAAGFQALVDGAEILYMTSVFYEPGVERGVRFDDPAFGIEWPLPLSGISDRDRVWPLVGAAERPKAVS